MSNVDRVATFAELNRNTAKLFLEIIKTPDFDEDQSICSIDEYRKAFNNCVDNIKEYADRTKSTFIVKLFEYYKEQRHFHFINGVDELFARRDFDTAEHLTYFNEINNTILNTIWRYDKEILDDLSLHCIEIKTAEIQIKSDELKYYFTSPFLGIGTGNENHFDNSLIPLLNKKHNAKTIAGIALAIYSNDKVISRNKRPSTFSAWYEIFCNSIGATKKTYQPKDLSATLNRIVIVHPFLS